MAIIRIKRPGTNMAGRSAIPLHAQFIILTMI
jgi:hypothetical protein